MGELFDRAGVRGSGAKFGHPDLSWSNVGEGDEM
jgi:hypothetical protein